MEKKIKLELTKQEFEILERCFYFKLAGLNENLELDKELVLKHPDDPELQKYLSDDVAELEQMKKVLAVFTPVYKNIMQVR